VKISGKIRNHITPERMRFLKFCTVGGSGVFVNLFFTWVGYEFLFRRAGEELVPSAINFMQMIGHAPNPDLPEDLRKALAGIFGIIISIFTNFLLNDLWTWSDRDKEGGYHFFIRLMKFYLVSAFAALFQYGIYLFLTTQLNVHYLLSQLIGIAVATPINFLVNNLWTFKIRKR
jgi:putative flippase GtrA